MKTHFAEPRKVLSAAHQLGGTALILAPLVLACASPAAVPEPRAPHGDTDHEHASPLASASAAHVAPLVIPEVVPDGPSIQASVLLDSPGLKVMAIRLRGVDLPPHRSDFPVVIAAVAGSGVVGIGDRRVPVDPMHSVALGPRVEHSVTPNAGADLVLLVTHARGGRTP